MWSYLSLHTLLLYEKKTDKYNRFEEKYVTICKLYKVCVIR